MSNPALNLRLSRSGKILVFLAVFLAFAAQNTGNNLLYLMSSCFVTCFFGAAALSLRNLAGIHAEITVDEHGFVGEKINVRCVLTETSGRNRFFLGFESDFTCFLPANESLILVSGILPEKRGLLQIDGLKVFSFYPADLFVTYIALPAIEVIVGPKLLNSEVTAGSNSLSGLLERHQPGKEGDYWMQTLYADGQDASMINWAISARSNHEWVLLRSVRYGIPEKLFFDLGKVSEDFFEDSLRLIAGFLLGMRQKNRSALVWAWDGKDGFTWVELSSDFSGVVRWLAGAVPGKMPVPDDDDVVSIDITELFGKNHA